MQNPAVPAAFAELGDNDITIPKLVHLIRKRAVIPFIGAGMSMQVDLPGWRAFLMKLAPPDAAHKIAARLDAGDYEEAAQDLLELRGPDVLQDAIDQTFGRDQPEILLTDTALHHLARIPFELVLTTNFDFVIERIFELAGAGFADNNVILGMKSDMLRAAFQERGHVLVHLHGVASDRTDRVLTVSDYRHRYGTAEPLAAVIELAATRPLLFLGCSLENDRPVRVLKKRAASLRKRGAAELIEHYAVLEYPRTPEAFKKRCHTLAQMRVRPIWFPSGEFQQIKVLIGYIADRVSSETGATERRLFPELTRGVPSSRTLNTLEQVLCAGLGLPGGHPPLFVGRSAQLRDLDAWLADPGAPYALIAEPAGRGKSSLVLQWAHRVAVSAAARVVFVPISLRFDFTAALEVFELLGERLRFLRGFSGTAHGDAAKWAAEIERELREDHEAPLLLVLDGIDEAVGWRCGVDLFFPVQPGARVKVLAAARELGDRDAEGWRRVLRWNTAQRIRVPTLLRSALNEAVVHELPAGPNHAELVERLWDLTDHGDPLLLRLYIDALQRNDIRVKDLSRSQPVPGLDGYLGLWWEYQRNQWKQIARLDEDTLILTLSALACKLGPITRVELQAVLPKANPIRIDAIIDALDRFLVPRVQGEAQAGYTFTHPRLADFFRSKYVPLDEVTWHRRFADAGARQRLALERGDIAPDQVHPYFLRHSGQHLEQAHATVEELSALVGTPWLSAWRNSPWLDWGFLADADRLARAAERCDRDEIATTSRAPHFHHEVKSALVKASLVSVSRGLPAELLRALLAHGIWDYDRALAEARQAPVPLSRAISYCVLASHHDAPDPGELLEASAAIASTLVGRERDEAWKAIAEASLRIEGNAGDAQRLVADIAWRRQFLIEHAAQTVSTLIAHPSLELFEGLPPEDEFAVLLAFVDHASGALRDMLLARGEVLARAMSDHSRVIARLRLSSHRPESRVESVDDALDVAAAVATWGMADELCAGIFDALPEQLDATRRARAHEIAETVDQGGRKGALARAALVRVWPEPERSARRRQLLSELLRSEWLSWSAAVNSLGPWSEDIPENEVADVLRAFPREPRLAPVTLRLSERISDKVFAETISETLRTLFLTGRTYEWAFVSPHVPPHRWGDVLTVMAQLVADPDFRPRGEAPDQSVMGRGRKRAACCKLLQEAASHIAPGALPIAAEFASSSPQPAGTHLLLSLLPRLDPPRQERAVREILEQWPRLPSRVEAMSQLRANLPAGLPDDVQAFVVDSVADESRQNRNFVIAQLAPKLSAEALGRLLLLSRRIEDDFERGRCVTALATFGGPSTAVQRARSLISRNDLSSAAPLLDAVDPADFRQILNLVAGQTHPEPHGCAAILEAIANRGDPALLPEILERLQRLPFDWNELRDRPCLSTIVRRMAVSEMVPQAIQAIKDWPDEDDRAHAVVSFASCVGPEQFETLFKIACDLRGSGAQMEAISGIAHLAPPGVALSHRIDALANTDSWFALRALATNWREPIKTDVLWPIVFERFPNLARESSDLLGRALRLATPDQRRWAVDSVLRQWRNAQEKERFRFVDYLVVLVEFCSASQHKELAELGADMRDVHDWARIAETLFDRSTATQRNDFLANCQPRWRPANAAITKVIAARHGGEEERREAVREIMALPAARENWCLPYLVPALKRLAATEAYAHCARLVKEAAEDGRSQVFERILTLAPVIATFQTAADVSSIIESVEIVSEWWP